MTNLAGTVAKIKQLIEKAPVTTGHLADLFERVPGSQGEYRLRSDVVSITIPSGSPGLEFVPAGRVFHLPTANTFYIQWDGMGASTFHYYGPFMGDPRTALGLSSADSLPARGVTAPTTTNDAVAAAEQHVNNMKQWLIAILMYQSDQASQWPDTLSQVAPYLRTGGDNQSQIRTDDYVYKKPAPGLDGAVLAGTAMLFEKTPILTNRTVIGYADGHVVVQPSPTSQPPTTPP
jgi:hypothetical protein